MNVLINISLIFIFLITSFYFKYPDLTTNNYILHKLIIFATLYCFQFVIMLIDSVRKGCRVDVYDIAKNSLETAIGGVLGYTVYTDLLLADVVKLKGVSDNVKNLNITIVVTLFITLMKVIRIIFEDKNISCV